MIFASLSDFLQSPTARTMPAGVLGIVFAADRWMLAQTVARMRAQAPQHLLVIGPAAGEALASAGGDAGFEERVSVITQGLRDMADRAAILNALIGAMPGRWLHWLENGEFFFFPWCETRRIGDIATFLGDERRRALFSYTLDLYGETPPEPDASLEEARLWFDRKAYHAFPGQEGELSVFGGLSWRFEECFGDRPLPIGRPALFRADPDVKIGHDLAFDALPYGSVSAPWHHSPTGAVMSLRNYRALITHPDFSEKAASLIWPGSEGFQWSSAQLLECGMIEPGQWF